MPLAPDQILLTDRVALVTGAAVGLGEAIALAYAQFGAHVAICDRDVENLDATAVAIEAVGRRVVAGELDVRDGEAVREFARVVGDEFGHVDVLVNNAGGGFAADVLEVNDKGQDALVRENFTSVTHFVRAVVPLIPESGGSIINLTSIEAHRGAPSYGIYSAMKAGVANLSKTLAMELGARRIRVNCIAPDVIPTPGMGGLAATERRPNGPLPVVGHVDDVAGAAVYLASDLSRFVTGTTIHVDGGNLAASGWVRKEDGSWATS